MVGTKLTAKINGQIVVESEDTTIEAGQFGIGSSTDERIAISAVEYLNLDGTAMPATATQTAPFVNSLGMKFVPVPITGGPTGGQRLLFSVWDTRVQDYEVFATETKRVRPMPEFEQGSTHPAVLVSWVEAQSFCAWLTKWERTAGKLGANEAYRLPSDHEWSCAVGLGDKEDAAKLPSEKDQKITDAFPWGTTWPPPAKSGNYWSEELRPLLAAGKFSYIKGEMPGYRDGFATTSPVGSFAANRYGLYDMGGNLWQWCEDWFDKEQKDRVTRGASWSYYGRSLLLSSARYHNPPGVRNNDNGFRCVLAPATGGPPERRPGPGGADGPPPRREDGPGGEDGRPPRPGIGPGSPGGPPGSGSRPPPSSGPGPQ